MQRECTVVAGLPLPLCRSSCLGGPGIPCLPACQLGRTILLPCRGVPHSPASADIGLLSVAMRPILTMLGATNSSVLDNPIEYEANWVRRTYWPLEVRAYGSNQMIAGFGSNDCLV